MTPAAPALEAIELTKTYPGGIEAVKGLTFQVDRGEAFGLLGPNGAGKTTTVGMLNTTVEPTSGVARLGGYDVASEPHRARAMSSVVFQDAVVDGPLTGRQNLELHLKLWGVPPAAGRSRLAELTQVVGIGDLLDRPVDSYSGGQRRRLEIVRALLSDPEVLFLDEPTAGLDTRIRHDLFDVVATLREQTGVTVLLTTHYLDEAERLCDRIAIVDAGVMVACDTPANFLAALGEEVVELRVDDPEGAVHALTVSNVPASELSVIGNTVTVVNATRGATYVNDAIATAGVVVRSSTTRRPTLDDVYLRLTGGRIDSSN